MASLIRPPKMPRTRANISLSTFSNAAASSADDLLAAGPGLAHLQPEVDGLRRVLLAAGGTMPMATL